MFDVRNYKHMDVVIGAGLGGGSLIYANVFLIPPDEVFADKRWPQSCKKGILMPYYLVAKEVLGSRPIPLTGDPRRDVTKRKLFQHVARETKRQSELLDINVFFGNNYNWPPPGRTGDAVPLPIGHQEKNRYGALQTSCVYCAECIIGCNYHAKNTLDLNYLYVAKECYQADIRTEHLAEKIVPVDERNKEDPEGRRLPRLPGLLLGSKSRKPRFDPWQTGGCLGRHPGNDRIAASLQRVFWNLAANQR